MKHASTSLPSVSVPTGAPQISRPLLKALPLHDRSRKRTAVLATMGEKGAVARVQSGHQDTEMEEVKFEDSLDYYTVRPSQKQKPLQLV